MVREDGKKFERIDLKVGPCPDEIWDTVQELYSEFELVKNLNMNHT